MWSCILGSAVSLPISLWRWYSCGFSLEKFHLFKSKRRWKIIFILGLATLTATVTSFFALSTYPDINIYLRIIICIASILVNLLRNETVYGLRK